MPRMGMVNETSNRKQRKRSDRRRKKTKDNRPVWFLAGLIFGITFLSLAAWKWSGDNPDKKKILSEELMMQKEEIQRMVDAELKAEKETQDKYLLPAGDSEDLNSASLLADEFVRDILREEEKDAKQSEKSPSDSGENRDISLMEQLSALPTGIESLGNQPSIARNRRPRSESFCKIDDSRSMFAYSRSYPKADVLDGRRETQNDEGTGPVVRSMSVPEERSFPTLIYNQLPAVKIFEGNWLEGVLLHKLSADSQESPVIISVARDFYDDGGRFVAIPCGTRVIGRSQANQYQGASRLYVWFERMILPNGVSIRFPESGRALALDREGVSGMVSRVNRHFFLRFGNALMFGLIDGLAGLTQRRNGFESNRAVVIERTGQNFSQINSQMLQERTNILPTITVRQGHRMKVYISCDLMISPYDYIENRGYSK